MANRASINGPRPPSYPSKATLAAELDMSESTVDAYVKRGLSGDQIDRLYCLIRGVDSEADET